MGPLLEQSQVSPMGTPHALNTTQTTPAICNVAFLNKSRKTAKNAHFPPSKMPFLEVYENRPEIVTCVGQLANRTFIKYLESPSGPRTDYRTAPARPGLLIRPSPKGRPLQECPSVCVSSSWSLFMSVGRSVAPRMIND